MTLLPGPGILTVTGAGPLAQEPLPRPSAVESPLPGGVATVVRFVFNLPSWVQIAAAAIGLAVVVALLALLWRRRAPIRLWVVTRRRGLKIALAAAAAAVVLGFVGFGTASWKYMQHDNGFCTGCHVMGPAYQRFTRSEHDSLSCHSCHDQSLFASMRQLYLWVAERPSEIGPHAKVPSEVCKRCHVTGQPKVWQRIASTAGHRTHLESDSAALKNIQCVTCHGLEVHRFAPVDSTCAQSGCHVTTGITLGKMQAQTSLHCVTCHRFTREVPTFLPRDSARGRLVPGVSECFSCHQMRAILAEFDAGRDPHAGACGACHDPHKQARPQEAATTCAKSGCHDDWRARPFHVGPAHRKVGQQCTLCHLAHAAKVDPSDCAGCHAAVRERRAQLGVRRLMPPLPFDTTKALHKVSAAPAPVPFGPRKGKGDRPFFDDPPPALPPGGGGPVAVRSDTFPHDRHKSLACITCHASQREHSRLTFQPPRGCQICHHETPAKLDCASCHTKGELAAPDSVTVRVVVSGSPARKHPARFDHAQHRATPCLDCHTTAVTLEAAPPVASCKACHDDHHAAGRRCSACHAADSDEAVAAHAPPERGHVACDACHAPATVARLVPDRAFCVTCHAEQSGHYAAQECTVCHFQAAPETARALLVEQASDST
jgi:nitrate/TMAO reductase-like tetraheme cytochrome c subunit